MKSSVQAYRFSGRFAMAVSRRPNAIRRLFSFGAALFFGALVAAAQTTPPAADWLPDGAIYALHVDQPAALLDLATELKLPAHLLGASPNKSTDKGFQLLVDTLSKRAGTDWKGLVANLIGGGITYAMYPGENSVWVFDAKDALVLDSLQQFVKVLAGAQHLAAPASAKPAATFYQEYPGNTAAWSLDGKQFFARTGNRLLLASRGEVLKTLFTPHPQSSLASSPLYLQAKHALGDTSALAYVNMAALNQYPPIQKGLALSTEPFDVILNGAWKQSLRDAHWLATGLTIERAGAAKKLHLHLVTDGKLTPTAAGAFTLPGSSGVLPNLTVPRELAAATLWRDLGKFYALRETLFPQKTSGGILLENFMEIFFTGRNLTEDVFSRFHPQVRLVVARQQYDPAIGSPDEQYPAAALVFRTDPQSSADFGEVLEEAWQKAVGLTNFTRGQNALPGVILDRQTYGGVPFTFGYFSPRAEKDRAHLPVRFNLRPAIVHAGPYIILSTTDGLARDLIDAVNKEDGRSPAQTSNTHTVLEVTSPAEIAALLQVDKASMVRQSVLTSGKKPEQAAREFDRNLAWLDKLNRAKLSIGASQVDLELELK
jgi:hypothetical protein